MRGVFDTNSSVLFSAMKEALFTLWSIPIVPFTLFALEGKPNLVHSFLTRDDTQTATLASQLVPGDLVKFGIGDRIPADCRLITVMIKTLITLADHGEIKFLIINEPLLFPFCRQSTWRLTNPI